ncbi:MAG: sigma-54-dependent Fis family transcriptional regulator [Planctomycetaceae bacterium]|jgi:DNA-binding NtrC family response regulator|nr:sigma-54-dependent Fis family transcriptional regulator [Planctomycetaceae bacterium]
MLDKILIVDDEPLVLETLAEVLGSEGFPVTKAQAASEGLRALEGDPHALVLSDIRMPGMDGIEFLREVRRLHPGTDVMLMTGFGSLDGAIDAMALGASDYLMKPLKSKEILARVRAILTRRRLESELHALHSELRARYDMHNLVAESPRMHALVTAVRRVCDTEDTLLLHAEPGSGCRYLARSIHYSGRRRNEEFIVIDARTLQESELESALFGHETPGGRRRRGALERVGAGTVHLAGLEFCSPSVQARLGETLASRRMPAGGRVYELECRLILSCEQSPAELFHAGRLTSALDRLREAATLYMPSLAQRREDLPGLVAVFVETHASEHGRSLRLQPGVIDRLSTQHFPRNVSQLFAALSNAATFAVDGELTLECLERSLRQSSLSEDHGIAEHLGDREYQVVVRAVQRNPGRLDKAARELGISRTTLWRRMRKYDIKLV